jgi:hypothetical protein
VTPQLLSAVGYSVCLESSLHSYINSGFDSPLLLIKAAGQIQSPNFVWLPCLHLDGCYPENEVHMNSWFHCLSKNFILGIFQYLFKILALAYRGEIKKV